jgi:hypothetical protein
VDIKTRLQRWLGTSCPPAATNAPTGLRRVSAPFRSSFIPITDPALSNHERLLVELEDPRVDEGYKALVRDCLEVAALPLAPVSVRSNVIPFIARP